MSISVNAAPYGAQFARVENNVEKKKLGRENRYMNKIRPQYHLSYSDCRPRTAVLSSRNQGKARPNRGKCLPQAGCFEDLQEAANRSGVEVRLKDVQTDLGWEIFLFPFYKGYKCIGEITGPARARS